MELNHMKELPTDLIVKKHVFDKQFETEILARKDWNEAEISSRHSTVWYTDGSNRQGGLAEAEWSEGKNGRRC